MTSDEHVGQTYTLSGPELLTHSKIAARISRGIGRQVQYVDLPPAELKKAMLAQGTPSWLADALLELQAFYTDGADPLSPTTSAACSEPNRAASTSSCRKISAVSRVRPQQHKSP